MLYIYNKGNVFFRQLRPGQNGRPFFLYKFQTMRDARNTAGELLPDAQRLTPLGRLIRRLSLDELPQLYSVLRGDMSLVGPRPLLMEYLPLYTPEQAKRHLVKPGITGWAQVNGRNKLTWEQKFAYDLWYVEHVSFRTDFFILLRTIKKVLSGSGVSMEVHATMPKFEGTKNATLQILL
ncbi:MAG: sugar transferase [Pontibacter sp.]|nr:sugar transferase [Pontibacter sp.]